ncbi:MAG: hypothetical protein WCS32_03990, partial [Candidatus Izemoplasmatales bacterium]
MKKKISVLGFVLIIIGFGIYYLIGPERINSILDQQAPVINIDELPSFYRLGTDFDYSIIKCEDNIDKTCTVERSSDFNINVKPIDFYSMG